MSKRSRKRRRKGPGHKPAQKKAPNKIPKKKQSEVEVVDHTRRNLLIGLGGTAVVGGIVGLIKFLGREEPAQEPVHREALQKSLVAPKIPEYDEWASKIELPTVSYSKDQWSTEQIDEHFLPKGLPKESASNFYSVFSKYTDESLAELERVADIEERNKRIEYYIGQVFNIAFQGDWQKKKKETLMAGLNRLLIPNGQWLFGIHQVHEKHDTYILYPIESIEGADIKTSKTFKRIPVINLGKGRNILTDPSVKVHSFVGTYWDRSDFIVYDKLSEEKVLSQCHNYEAYAKRGGQPPTDISNQEKIEKLYNVWLAHEGMHAALYHLDPDQDVKATYRIGTIDMGHYQLPVGNYGPVAHMELHELAACGMGLKNAENVAKYVAFFIGGSATPNYKFAEHVLVREILHSPHLNESVRHKFSRISTPEFVELLQNIPDEALHTIGERMAKLGMHLMQKG